MFEQKTRERVFDLVLEKMSQIDLSSTPVCATLDFDVEPRRDEIHLLFRFDCYGTKAAESSEAVTNLADKSKRRKFLKGETQSYFYGSGKIWFVTADASTQAEAIDKEIYVQAE